MAEVESRVQALRAWCRGRGLFPSRTDVTVTADQLALFGADDLEDLKRLIKRGLDFLPDDSRMVLKNALGGGAHYAETLSKRRSNYEAAMSISARTILRHEEAAARQLAEVIGKLLSSSGSSVSLDERVAHLEVIVRHQMNMIEVLLGQLLDGKELDPHHLGGAINGYGIEGSGDQPTHVFQEAMKHLEERYLAIVDR